MRAKKRIAAMFCLVIGLCAVLGGCGGSGGSAQSADRTEKNGGVEEVLEAGMQEQGSPSGPETPEVGQGAEVGQSAEQGSPSGQATAVAQNAAGPETPSGQETSEVGQSGAVSTDVDVDLTTLSATMVYSEVYNMMTNSDAYLGKSVRMKGELAYYKDEATGKEYFACIIRDATACCAQGIEFELAGDYKYPDDYPELGTEVTVKGVFDVYSEGDNQYVTLRNASME